MAPQGQYGPDNALWDLNTSFTGMNVSDRAEFQEPRTPGRGDSQASWSSPIRWDRSAPSSSRSPLPAASRESQRIAKQEMNESVLKKIDENKSSGRSHGALAESKYAPQPTRRLAPATHDNPNATLGASSLSGSSNASSLARQANQSSGRSVSNTFGVPNVIPTTSRIQPSGTQTSESSMNSDFNRSLASHAEPRGLVGSKWATPAAPTEHRIPGAGRNENPSLQNLPQAAKKPSASDTTASVMSARNNSVRSASSPVPAPFQNSPLFSSGTATGGWPRPRERTRQHPFRRVIICDLEKEASHSTICSLVWGGPIERIIYTPGQPEAEVVFLDPKHCAAYYEQTTVPPRSGDKQYTVKRSEVDDQVGQRQVQWSRERVTRCVTAFPYPTGMFPIQLKRLAVGAKQNPREVESSTAGYCDVSNRNVTLARWRFTSIDDAVAFYEELIRRPEWRASKILFDQDPCSAANGPHAAF